VSQVTLTAIIWFYFTTMALPLETEVYNYPAHDIEITLKHRHGDIAMIFMHNYIAIIIKEWNGYRDEIPRFKC
jgi:hypothetical protein